MDGGDGRDTISGGEGADTLFGGTGFDWLSYAESGKRVLINLAAGTASGGHANGDTFSGFEAIIGSAFDDRLTGDAMSNFIRGGAGADTMNGRAGFDWLSYFDSTARVVINLKTGAASGGHAAGDVFSGFEAIAGSTFNDRLTGDDNRNNIRGGDGADTMNGGSGFDTLSYVGSDAGVRVNLNTGAASGGDASGDKFKGFEAVTGSAHDDVLRGDSGDNVIRGDAGADRLAGGGGKDVLDYRGSDAGVRVHLKKGTAAGGDAAGDSFSGFEDLAGSSFDDVLTGNDAGNQLIGREGDDVLRGLKGADVLKGGSGSDKMTGGRGNDIFVFDAESYQDGVRDRDVTDAQGADIIRIVDGVTNGVTVVEFKPGLYRLTGTGLDNDVIEAAAGLTVVRDKKDLLLVEQRPPEITSNGGGATAVITVPENSKTVATIQATDDKDAMGSGLVFSITGGADAGLFSIDPTSGQLSFATIADFEAPVDAGIDNDYDVQVTVTDSGGKTDTQDITVKVTNVNESPTISSDRGGTNASVNVAENTTAVTNVQSIDDSDSEGSGLTYALTGGADQALFDIDANTGALSFKSAPDFEAPGDDGTDNVYNVQVTVTDSGGLTDLQNLIVTVTNTNEAPIITSDGGGANVTVNMAENTTAVTNVQSIDDSDSEGSGITYSLSGGADQALFDINANTGALSFKSAPDFENPTDNGTNNVYNVQVTSTDSGGLTDVQNVAVTVTDLAEPAATDDGYTVIGNVGITVNAASGILANDGGSPTTLKFGTTMATADSKAANGSNSVTTSNGGTVTVNANGSFTYDNAAGFDGTDTFYYEISNANGSDVGRVDFTVGNTVWIIDNNASGSSNEGTLDNPFTSLGGYNLTTLEEAGDNIFLFGSATPYTGGISLLANQKLIGQGAAGTSLASLLQITEPTGSETLPTLDGYNPVIQNISGVGISMGSNNTIRGVDVGNTSAGLAGISGSNFGTAVIDDVSVTGTGGGVYLNTGTVTATFREISVNDPSSSNGIYLQNLSGSFTVTGDGSTATTGGNGTGGTISNVYGNGVQLSNVTNITLQNMNIGNPAATVGDLNYTTNSIGSNGLQASTVNGLKVLNTTVSETAGHGITASGSSGILIEKSEILNAGDGSNDNAVKFNSLTGTNVIVGSIIDGSFGNAIQVDATTGTTSNFGVLNSVVQDTRASGSDGIDILVSGFSKLVARIEGTTFDDIADRAILGTTSAFGELQATISGNTFLESGLAGAIGLFNSSSGVLNTTISGNTFTDDTAAINAIDLSSSGSGATHGTITGNTVNKMGLLASSNSDGDAKLKIDTNTVTVNDGTVLDGQTAIQLISRDYNNTSPLMEFTINNNTITLTQDAFDFSVPVLLSTSNNGRMNGQITNNSIIDLDNTTTVEISGDDIELAGMIGPGIDSTLLSYLAAASNTLSPNQAFVWGTDAAGFTGTVTIADPTTTESFVLV